MPYISEISPDGGTSRFDLKDKNAQTKNLTSPIEVGGEQQSTVEDCLSALAESGGGGTPGVFYETEAEAQADIDNIPEGSLVYTNDDDIDAITALHLVGSQVGSGSKNVTVDTSKQKRLLAITKKSGVIVESKEIPVSVLETGDVIVLGDTAHVIYDSRDDDASYAPSVFPVSKAYNGKRAGLTQYSYYQGNYNTFASNPSTALAMGTTVYMSSSAELADTAKITFNGSNSFTITVTDSTLSVYVYVDMLVLGGSTSARNVSFDGAGTNLVSTDLQGVVLELLEKMGGLGMPKLNFTKPLKNFASGSLTYTATKTCYLCGMTPPTNDGYVKINNIQIASSALSSTPGWINQPFIECLRINSGDIVTVSSNCELRVFDTVS